MKGEPQALPDVLLFTPRVFRDARGCFFESWARERYADGGAPDAWVQDNISVSHQGVLRGLHCQHPGGQGKLVTVLRGAVYDVAVDVRVGSPQFGQWVGMRLDDTGYQQLYVPPGFAHGFVALSDDTVFSYKCTAPYDVRTEFSIRWDDPALGISWPMAEPRLSAKDAAAPLLRDVPVDRLPMMPVAAAR